MNLSTTYMGFELSHPPIPGASPMSDNLDTVRRLEDAGAPMIVHLKNERHHARIALKPDRP